MKTSITAIVLTKNEETNISSCIESILWCDEIIVIDDFSEDETVVRIKNYELRIKNKIKIYQRHLNGDFSAQRNFGLEKARGKWVLFIDADEVVIEELKKEILTTCHPESRHTEFISASPRILKQVQDDNKLSVQHDTNGYYIKRKDYFLEKWLKYGETGNIRLLRLARRNSGIWKGKVHEIWFIEGKTGELNYPILHYPHPTIKSFLYEINFYTDLLVSAWKKEKRDMNFLSIILYPVGKFLQNYIVRQGFRDGIPGLIMALMMSWHSFLARSKYYLLKND